MHRNQTLRISTTTFSNRNKGFFKESNLRLIIIELIICKLLSLSNVSAIRSGELRWKNLSNLSHGHGKNHDLDIFPSVLQITNRRISFPINMITLKWLNIIMDTMIARVHLSAVYYVELFQITDQMSFVNKVIAVKCVCRICPG